MGDLTRFHSLFDDTFLNSFLKPMDRSGNEKVPAVDIQESETGYSIKADLPGIKKEDIHVTLENGILSIEAETSKEGKEEKDGVIIRQERHFGKFVRRLSVGSSIDPEAIKARFEDGVLCLELPKPEPKGEKSKRVNVE